VEGRALSEDTTLYRGGYWPGGVHPRPLLLRLLLRELEIYLTARAVDSMAQHYAGDHARRDTDREASDR
jgi:hypothetical protein